MKIYDTDHAETYLDETVIMTPAEICQVIREEIERSTNHRKGQ